MAVQTNEPALLDVLEASIRQAMARIPKARGWDTQRARADDLAWLDAALDQWNELTR